MGLKRFQEWIYEEGLPGSEDLFRCYSDMQAYNRLLDEVSVSLSDGSANNRRPTRAYDSCMPRRGLRKAEGEEPVGPTDFRLLPAPPETQNSLAAAALGMRTTETAVLDRLYADEFKRFIAGRMVSQSMGMG